MAWEKAGLNRAPKIMKLCIVPPDGFTASSSRTHLRQLVRTRAKGANLRVRDGRVELRGSVPDLIPLRFHLRRFGYEVN